MSHLPGHEKAHILSFNSGVVLFELDGFRVDLFGLCPMEPIRQDFNELILGIEHPGIVRPKLVINLIDPDTTAACPSQWP